MIAHARNGWRNGWYIVPWQVTFRDVDAFSHVNNAVYFTYFEWARTQLWFAITGGSKPRDVDFIVARAECDFRQQIGMEQIEVRVRIGELRTTSIEFLYEIWKEGGASLAATGRVVVVLFDWDRNGKTPISEELRSAIRRFQGEE